MNPVNPFYAVVVLLFAVTTATLIVKRFGVPSKQGRYASIDGLRGYLAIFVFLHHSCIWFFYLKTGRWQVPPSNLYTHFGQSSVAFFFMITGFLFFSKLLDSRTRDVDWAKLFLSRILRLTPLYLFVMVLLFSIIAYLSDWTLNEPILKVVKDVVKWLGFTVLGAPDINGVENAATIVAGVTWSLKYEWFFYLSLPVIALLVNIRPPFVLIVLGVISALCIAVTHAEIIHLVAFLGGMFASILVRWEVFCKLFVRRVFSLIILTCIVISVTVYPSAYDTVPMLLLSIAFILIACGNNLFGVLDNPVSRTLGEKAYSIYLLHGIVLFVLFNFIIGIGESRLLSPLTHWLLVAGVTPILIVICFFTFRFIERPAMESTNTLINWFRSFHDFTLKRQILRTNK